MKDKIRLYKKLSLIFIPVIILVVFFEVQARNFQNGFALKKNFLEKDISDLDILILGSSHGYFSINPEVLSRNSFNLAFNSQDLYYDYKLLEKYKGSMKNLKCIILSVSYFTLWYDMNEAPEKWRKYFYKEYFGINPRSDLSLSDMADVKAYSFAFFYGFERVLFGTLNKKAFSFGCDMNSSGWYTDTLNHILDSTGIFMMKGKARVDFTNSLINKNNYTGNIRLLEQLVKYADDNGIKLLFITTPVSYPYSLYADKNICNEYWEKINSYTNNKNIFYLNYFNDKRFYMRDYHDFDHLNGEGAMKFSSILKDTMTALNIIK